VLRRHRQRQCGAEFLDRHQPSSEGVQRRGRWWRFLIDDHSGQQVLIVLQKNRSVLQEGVPVANLGAADELPPLRDQLA
jgi:hypothetical protein